MHLVSLYFILVYKTNRHVNSVILEGTISSFSTSAAAASGGGDSSGRRSSARGLMSLHHVPASHLYCDTKLLCS